MVSEDSIFESLSPVNSAGDDDFAKESELKPLQRRQRKRQAPNELPKGKGKRTKNWSSKGESSDPEPKGKEESVRELIIVKKKSVPQVLKNLKDRANRRIKSDEIADMLSCICLLSFVMEHVDVVWDLFSPIVQSLSIIVSQWPARSDLIDIKKSIRDMEGKERDKANLSRDDDDDEKMEVIQELEKIEDDIKSLDERRAQDLAKANELTEIFTTESISMETLREKLSTAFPWLFRGEIATNELPKAKRKGKGREVPVKELIKKSSVAKVLKNLRDRVNRRIKIGRRLDMESCIRLMCFVIKHRVLDLFSPLVQSLNKIKSQWPTRSDLDGIKKNIKKMEDEERDKGKLHTRDNVEMKMEVSTYEYDLIRGLEEIEQKIKSSDEEFQKDSTKVMNLEEIFITEGVGVETLREKLTTAFPWISLEEIATNKLPNAINLEDTTKVVAEAPSLEIASIDPEGNICNGIDRIGEKTDNKSPATFSMTPDDSYGIPQAIKALDGLSEVPKPSDIYFFSLKLLGNKRNSDKRLVFLSIAHEHRAWWLKKEMEEASKSSNGS